MQRRVGRAPQAKKKQLAFRALILATLGASLLVVGALEMAHPDRDRDGLPDDWERRHFENTQSTPVDDPDDDGCDNACEYAAGTDPQASDTDSDGVLDGDELGSGLNPLQPDSDSDGLSDGDEVNIHGTDPLNPDTDGDGFTDGQEVHSHKTDPLVPDADQDLLSDIWEELYFGSLAYNGTDDPDGDGCDNRCEADAGTNPADGDDHPGTRPAGDGTSQPIEESEAQIEGQTQASATEKPVGPSLLGAILHWGTTVGKALALLGGGSLMVLKSTVDGKRYWEELRGKGGQGSQDAPAPPKKPEAIIQVRCLACGYIDTEDAAFCSGCGGNLRPPKQERPARHP